MLFIPCIFIFLRYARFYLSVEFKLMDIDSESLNIPEMSYASVVSLPSEEFQRIVRDLQCLGNVCTITAKGDSIKFLAAGDLGSGGVLLRTMSGEGNRVGPVTVSVSKDLEMSFTLRYLHLFSKKSPLSGEVTLSMNHDKPMMITY
jgi:proliferating cell nuclear antigen